MLCDSADELKFKRGKKEQKQRAETKKKNNVYWEKCDDRNRNIMNFLSFQIKSAYTQYIPMFYFS